MVDEHMCLQRANLSQIGYDDTPALLEEHFRGWSLLLASRLR